MRDVEERLRARRKQALARLEAIGSPTLGTRGYAEQPHLLQEVAQIDTALLQADNTAALQHAAEQREQARLSQDDAAYWFRRFMLSLQIGNGAGFVAALAGMLQGDEVGTVARLAAAPAVLFGFGVLIAGLLPGLLWFSKLPAVVGRHGRAEAARIGIQAAAILSMLLFAWAIVKIISLLVMLLKQHPTAHLSAQLLPF